MRHGSDPEIDQSVKWASAEDILENDPTTQNVHSSLSERLVQNGNGSPGRQQDTRGTVDAEREAGNLLPPPPPPPPPSRIPGESYASAPIETSTEGQSTPLAHVRRASPVFNSIEIQPRVSSSIGLNPLQSNSTSSPYASYTYPPPLQSHHGSPLANPYHSQRAPYRAGSGFSQTFSSPAPMSNYVASPSPATFTMTGQTLPSEKAQFARANSYSARQTVGPSPLPTYVPQSAPRAYRPATTPSMQTPQSVYGGTSQSYQIPSMQTPYSVHRGTSQSYRPQTQTYSAPAQFMAGPQQDMIPGAPIVPQVSLVNQTPKTPKKADAFVANDPFRPHVHVKHDKHSKRDESFDDFDDIPLPGSAAPIPSSSAPMTGGSPYTLPMSRPPTYGGSHSMPISRPPTYGGPIGQAPIYGGSQSVPMGQIPVYGGSQSMPMSQPPTYGGSHNMPQSGSAALPARRPSQSGGYSVGNGASWYSPQPSGQPQPGRSSSPTPSDRPAQGINHGVSNSPAELPTFEVPPPQGDWNPFPAPSPPPAPVQQYPPRTSDPETDSMPWYDPYNPDRPSSPHSTSTLSPVTPVGPFPIPEYYEPTPGFPEPTHHQNIPRSFWSRIGHFFLWPLFHNRQSPYRPPSDVSVDTDVSKPGLFKYTIAYLARTLPNQIYLHFLLRLPSLYFSRVARIFEEADLTLPEIKKMALETASQTKGQIDLHVFETSDMQAPQYERLKTTWESFIDSVMREWKTFNIISVLLLSAILTILQIQGAADDPLTRYTALFSLICALVSLLFGCMYIIRFGSMRKTYKAAEWALEAKRTKTVIWWNVWVLLAMPAIWLTWSIVLYIACIMSYVWRSSAQDNGPPIVLSKGALLAVRIVLTTVLGLGMIYGWLILSTFSRYGEVMDRAWKKRIDGWLEEKVQMQPGPFFPYSMTPNVEPMLHPSSQTLYGDETYPGYGPPPGYIPQQYATPYYPDYGYRPDGGYGLNDGYGPDGGYGPDDGYGYSSDKAGATPYIPPAEPYGSTTPESSTSTDFVTRSNTQHNKMSGLQFEDSSIIGASPAVPTKNPLPLPPKIPIVTGNVPPKLLPQKATLAVPPPPSLPPIPGTPATAFADRNSFGSIGTGGRHSSGFGLDIGDGSDDSHENRVRFRSQGSTSTMSNGDADADGETLPQLTTGPYSSSTRLSPTPTVLSLTPIRRSPTQANPGPSNRHSYSHDE